uniref:Uncharacterized protein n=2 Tax=Cuerna arida TaxID=1464854 RepID=A0A1B6F950_9HEMI
MCELVTRNVPEGEHFQNLCEQLQLDLSETFSERDQESLRLCLQMIKRLCNNGHNINTDGLPGQVADKDKADQKVIQWLKKLTQYARRQSSAIIPAEDETANE